MSLVAAVVVTVAVLLLISASAVAGGGVGRRRPDHRQAPARRSSSTTARRFRRRAPRSGSSGRSRPPTTSARPSTSGAAATASFESTAATTAPAPSATCSTAPGMLKAPARPPAPSSSWGKKKKGKWITVYANSGHTYAVVAGLRWDTSGGPGPRWHKDKASRAGYKVTPLQGLVGRTATRKFPRVEAAAPQAPRPPALTVGEPRAVLVPACEGRNQPLPGRPGQHRAGDGATRRTPMRGKPGIVCVGPSPRNV